MDPQPIAANRIKVPVDIEITRDADSVVNTNEASFTLFTQVMLGTGLPLALHSNVTVLPLRAVTCPVSGWARTVGGTSISTVCTKSLFS